jgi:tetratricopeptide (TPR) repeat protein
MTARRWRERLAGLLLFAAPLVAYLPLHSAGFIWDDDQYVTQNPELRDVAGLARIWLDPTAVPQYYPLVHTTYWAEYHLWGLDPCGYHAINVLLHALNGVLLWRVLARLRVPGALLAAFLFALHPVMTESVAWITERKNVLSLALALGALASYLRFAPLEPEPTEPGSRGPWYALSLALYVGALLSKTVVCTFAGVVLVLVWWKRARIRPRDVAPLVPFVALGLAAGLHTAWLERHHVGAMGAEWALGPIERVLLAGRALWFYAGKLAWPHPLIFFYPRWRLDAGVLGQLVWPAAAVALVAALWIARGRIGRGPLAAVLLFAGILAPALGFVDVYPFRYSYVADHFQYHASTALLALAAAGGSRLWASLGATGRRLAGAAAIALLAGLGAATAAQCRIYRDLETLYRDTIAKNPGAWNAYLNLANELSSEGRNAEALPLAREAARLAPNVADAHNTLGGVLFLVSAGAGGGPAQRDEAIAELGRAVELDPGHVDALYNAAVALAAAGRHEEAARDYARILAIDPGAVDAMIGLGRASLLSGQPAEAEAPLRRAQAIAPTRPDLPPLLDALARAQRAAP